MAAKIPWFERRFSFEYPVGVYPCIIERLRGTPVRIEELVRGLDAATLTRREREGTWSIQENVGHLIDLERVHDPRIDDYLAGASVLRAADLQNRATFAAEYNQRPIERVLGEFRQVRRAMVARLESLSDADFGRTAEHPRLKVSMRLVDMLTFTAEHDDYHLARITELRRLFGR